MKLKKYTLGFVVQEYEKQGDLLVCVRQEFVAGDQVEWEYWDLPVPPPENAAYMPFDMQQP